MRSGRRHLAVVAVASTTRLTHHYQHQHQHQHHLLLLHQTTTTAPLPPPPTLHGLERQHNCRRRTGYRPGWMSGGLELARLLAFSVLSLFFFSRPEPSSYRPSFSPTAVEPQSQPQQQQLLLLLLLLICIAHIRNSTSTSCPKGTQSSSKNNINNNNLTRTARLYPICTVRPHTSLTFTTPAFSSQETSAPVEAPTLVTVGIGRLGAFRKRPTSSTNYHTTLPDHLFFSPEENK